MNTKLAIKAIRDKLWYKYSYILGFKTRRYEKIVNGGKEPVYKKMSIPFIKVKGSTRESHCIGITFALVYSGIDNDVFVYGISYCSSDDLWDSGKGRYEAAKRVIRMVMERQVMPMKKKLDFSSCPQLAGIDTLDGGII
jgi:hypothetical protein